MTKLATTRKRYKLARARKILRKAICKLSWHAIGKPESDPGDSAAIWIIHDAAVAIGSDIDQMNKQAAAEWCRVDDENPEDWEGQL